MVIQLDMKIGTHFQDGKDVTKNEASTRGRHEVLTIQDGEDVSQNETSTRGRHELLTIQDGQDVA